MTSATYSPATVKRAQTILRNCETQTRAQAAFKAELRTSLDALAKVTPTTPSRTTRVAKAKRDATAWERRPASKGQIRRIRVLEMALGYRLSTVATIGTGLQARTLYRSLKAELAAA